jgi:hypothetical protein
MRELRDARVILRWAFLVLGVFLVIRFDLVLNSAWHLSPLAKVVFPNDPREQNIFVAVAMFVIMPCALLCLATAWGLERNKRWSHWTGLLACITLLPGAPWFTLIGAIGACVLLINPPRLGTTEIPATLALSKQTTDYWTAKRQLTRSQSIIYLALGACLIGALNGSIWVAKRIGLPEWNLGWSWWAYLFAFGLANTALHELGHAGMAWIMHDRLRAISIGPFTLSKTPVEYKFQFHFRRLFETGGYMGSVPTTGENLRLKRIAIGAAGPIVSLSSGLLMLRLFFSLPGTEWQGYWELVAPNAVLALWYALISIIPIGYSDGSMLFHLVLRTHAGRLLLDNVVLAQLDEEAAASRGRADLDKQVVLREQMLNRALKGGEANAMMIAICHQQVGSAKLCLEDWIGAQTEFRECLQFEAECALNPPILANSSALLHKTCVERHDVLGSERAFRSAIGVLERRKKDRDSAGRALTNAMMAELHQRAGKFEAGLDEAIAGLSVLPSGRTHAELRAALYSAQAVCQIASGFVNSGLLAANHAAQIIRSGEIPQARQNLAWNRISDLGQRVSRAGQPEFAVSLLREAIERLELGSASVAAAQSRIKLAAVLRDLGRLEEAFHSLPNPAALSAVIQRALLAERTELHLLAQRPEHAISDCQQLLALWRAELGAATETAAAEGLLARAFLDAGDSAQAKARARNAAEVLRPWQHPEGARCLITTALARWRTSREWTDGCIAQVLQQIQADPLLWPAEKARFLEGEADRLEGYGRSEDAQTLRSAALTHRRVPLPELEPAPQAMAEIAL